MRKFGKKRYVAVMTAMAMAASMMGSMSAMAANVSVRVEANIGNTDIWGTNPVFTAYRVFTGVDSNGTLTNIAWSADFDDLATDSDLLELVYGEGHTETEVTAEAVADYLADTTNQTITPVARAEAFAEIANSIVNDTMTGVTLVQGSNQTLDAGYYLIVNTEIGSSGVRNPIVMEVTSDGDIVIKAKTDRPTVVKKIWEERLEEQTANTAFALPTSNYAAIDEYINGIDDSDQWNDVADYDIGDQVPFKLMATIPAGTTTNYPSYKLAFLDTLDSNFERDQNGNNYMIYTQQGNGPLVYVRPSDSFYQVRFPGANGITIDFPDIKKLVGFNADEELKIYVFFTAELKSSAVAATGQENEVILQFSNDYTTDGMGQTEKDQVVAITFDVIIDKYTNRIATNSNAESKERLAGATFKLYRVKDTTVTTMKLNTAEVNGTYDLTDEATLENLELVKYSITTTPLDNYIGSVKVDKDGEFETFTTKGDNLTIHGLDRDKYLLVETNAPAGYNILKKAKEIDITNETTYNRDGYIDEQYTADGSIVYTVAYDGVVQADGIVSVLNKAGSVLPETGGAGTMALYIVGTLLMAGGVFFLTAKGRRKEELE